MAYLLCANSVTWSSQKERIQQKTKIPSPSENIIYVLFYVFYLK